MPSHPDPPNPDPLHADARRVISEYTSTDPAQQGLRTRFRTALTSPDALRRSCRSGHLTATAVVVDPAAARVLLTLHPLVGRWLPLGGHLEDDRTLAGAARREATEESGLAGLVLDPRPLRLDCYEFACSPIAPAPHLDVIFLAVAPPGAVPVPENESAELRWFRWDALPEDLGMGAVDSVRHAVDRVRGACGADQPLA